ncbi:MAG: hypothetical protein JSS02_27675 [Planctomycetes bacterium]|nr:hypothetical protein [Planctomycetota bacterium]
MQRHIDQPRKRANIKERRRGTILVVAAIVLVALIGLLGLVIDAGQLMVAHRQVQNAADAAAGAAAMDLLQGTTSSTARTTGTTFVQTYNGLADATVTINIPPTTGPHVGDSKYAEALVSSHVIMRFVPVLGVGRTQSVAARAVAGVEGNSIAVGVMTTNSNAIPGINLSGNGMLKVNGTVVDNSHGGGLNQNGQPVITGYGGNAITTSGNGTLAALDVESVGGVNNPAKIVNYNANGPSPLHAGVAMQPDPLQYMPAPTTANGAVATNYGNIKLSGNSSVTLFPGVYNSIDLSANSTVTMNPGIYVIKGGGLSISGNASVNGAGVMIYNTGSDYNVGTGLPDSGDANTAPPASGSATFGAISLTGNGTLNLTPYANSASPFAGMVVYQRRLNTQPISLSGNGAADILKGTVYAKWATLNLTGNGTFNAQFIVGQSSFSGNGNLIIDHAGQPGANSQQVFLVE